MVRIVFQDFQIGTISGSSGVFSGDNVQSGFKHTAKRNQSFGTVSGKDCVVADTNASLDDRDHSDTSAP